MKINVIPAGGLTTEHVAAWSRLQRADPALDSPFFRPEFTQAVASICDNVEVAVFEEDEQPIGFFPFQRQRSHFAVPVGNPLSDFQGVIAPERIHFSPTELLRECAVKAWRFNHLIVTQRPFQPFHCLRADSPYIDLTQGFEAYRSERQQAGSNVLRQASRKSRKLQREVGAISLEWHTNDADVFEQLIRWKRLQYRRIRSVDHLAPDWVVPFLKSIAEDERGEHLSGVLSALYAGDHLVAVHLGMVSGGVLHDWFPAYNPAFAKFSPGLILWLYLARQAAELGIRRIDLGKGDEPYKQRFKSGAIVLAEGAVDVRPAMATLQHGWLRARECVRSSVLRRPLQNAVRGVRAWVQYR